MTTSPPRTPEVQAQRVGCYSFALSCPRCGAPVNHVASGRVVAGTETRVIIRCMQCAPHLAEYVVEVFVRPVATRETPPGCGSEAGFQRHIRAHETPCGSCTEAHARRSNPLGMPAGGYRPRHGELLKIRAARREILAATADV